MQAAGKPLALILHKTAIQQVERLQGRRRDVAARHRQGGIRTVEDAKSLVLLGARLEILIGFEPVAWNYFRRRARSRDFDRTFSAQGEFPFEFRQFTRRTSAFRFDER